MVPVGMVRVGQFMHPVSRAYGQVLKWKGPFKDFKNPLSEKGSQCIRTSREQAQLYIETVLLVLLENVSKLVSCLRKSKKKQ